MTFVDTPGGDATTAVGVAAGRNQKPHLSVSPGWIDPASSAWADSRKPLVGDVLHINAEFWDQASDHDPQVVRIKPGK